MRLKKVAVVTGGSRGIGKAVSLKLAAEGNHVVINYFGNEEEAAETVRECQAYGVEALAVKGDIRNYADCEMLFNRATEITGQVHILVNNAGITKDNLIMKMSESDFDDVIDTNLKGSFNCMKIASRMMMKQRYGRIINISSVIGLRGNAGQVNYAASKAGVIGMTKSLAKELATRGVTVNAVAPGMIQTQMTSVLPDAIKEAMLEGIPCKRMGTPEDIAQAVAFFAQEASSYVTGQVLCVDGGMAV